MVLELSLHQNYRGMGTQALLIQHPQDINTMLKCRLKQLQMG